MVHSQQALLQISPTMFCQQALENETVKLWKTEFVMEVFRKKK